MATYVLRLMFEWGGGCLWCGNTTASARFGVGPIENQLPLSPETLKRLEELSIWHDESLNKDYPPDPGPWTPDEFERFESAARSILERIQRELGPDYEVRYKSL
jgi:hypothetical protein